MATEFTYNSGDRPLAGYTIKRGIGRGGFGEVYYAISDGGKEVALKLLRQSTESERRGIRDCLNYKHPHLVHLYDLREANRGEVWIIMEYVFGESLAQFIEKYPEGLPRRLVREWFTAIARAVAYLHDMGVVHRDLKPANIFIEEGHPKIGDYGLARRFSTGELERMTSGVGTPHYMAPEIRRGTYGRSVDIYACGIILYEMLTGRPPFDGDSPVDILMKHQTEQPDLSPIPEPLRLIIARSLEKDPKKRYQTMLEFSRAVEKVFESNQLSLDTPLPPPRVPVAPVGATLMATQSEAPRGLLPQSRLPVMEEYMEYPSSAARDQALPLDNSRPPPSPEIPQAGSIRRTFWERLGGFSSSMLRAGGICLLCSLPVALIYPTVLPWTVVAEMFVLSTLLSWGVLLVGRTPPPAQREWGRRGVQVLLGLAVGLFGAWLDGWSIPQSPQWGTSRDLVLPTGHRLSPELIGVGLRYALYFGLTMGAIRWWRLTDPQRKKRFRIWGLFSTALWACAFLLLSLGELVGILTFAAPIVIAAIALQGSAPWKPLTSSPAPLQPIRLRLPQKLA